MRPHRFGLPLTLAILVAAAPARGQDLSRLDTSLKYIPADATFYSTSLRLGEQYDRFVASNAFARLRDMPAMKTAVGQFQQQSHTPGNPIFQVMSVFREPANRELVELLGDMVRRECFVYGGANLSEFLPLMMELNAAMRLGPLTAMLSGRTGNKNQLRAYGLFETLNESRDKLQAPELVIGFRLGKKDLAVAQIKRLETVLGRAAENNPHFKGRVKRTGDTLTLTLDGSMVPWDKAEIEAFEETKGEFKDLVAKLKSLTLAVSVTVKNDYLLVGVGPTAGVIERFAQGPSLATRPELRPLARSADRPVTSVTYTSQTLATTIATSPEDVSGIFELVKAGLAQAPLSDARRQAIGKDLDQMAKEIAAALPRPAASMNFSVETPRGVESFAYDYGPAPDVPARPLTILDHIGGSPLVAVAGRTSDPVGGYRVMVRWLGVLYGHSVDTIKELAGDDEVKKLQVTMEMLVPLLKRLDAITGNQFLPALGDGEAAFVVDGKWASKSWLPNMDQGGAELPLFELACVRTVSDSGKVLASLQAYRALANDVLAKAREMGAQVPPDATVPPAQTKQVANGTLYFWPLPAAGQDSRIQPNLGLSDKALVVSLSLAHSERLLKPTPPQGALAERRPVYSVAIVDVAGLIGVMRPWAEKFGLEAAMANAPEDVPPGLRKQDLPAQAKTVFDVMQCLRTIRSVSYREGDATVTHTEVVIQDLQ